MAKKESEAEEVVQAVKPVTKKKQKRVFKTPPTLRDQTTKRKSEKIKIGGRIRKIFGAKIFYPLRWVGRFIARIWSSKVFTPIRFISRLIGKVLFPTYFRNSWKELRLVIWPNFRTTWRLTFAVIIFGAVFGLFIAGIDVALEKLFREVLIGK
jgi:preprotein translocase SecE subunit